MIPAADSVPVEWLQLLAESTLKGSLLLLMGGAVAVALYRSSAALRHAVWTTAIAGVLVIAPLALLLPAIHVHPPGALAGTLTRLTHVGNDLPIVQPAGTAEMERPRGAASPNAAGTPAATAGLRLLPSALLGVWAAGALILSCCFLAAGVRLSRIARQSSSVAEPSIDRLALSAAQRLGVDSTRVRLRWTEREFTPMTWGLRRPVLILPVVSKTWDEERLGQVLVHELGHIQRWDVLTQALSSAVCALYWFNPLVWMAARQMLVERERACDDLVLESGATPSSYAHGLLEIARSLGARWTAAHVSPAMARRSQISGRLLAVLDPDRSRQGLGRRVALVAALAGAGLVLPLAVLQPVAAIHAAAASEPQVAVAPAPAIGPDDFKAIGAVYDEWKSAIRRRDARAISLLYTADGMVVTPARPSTRGRQSVADLNQYYFDFGLASIEIHTEEMYTVGDLICELGTSDALTASGRVLSVSRYMTLWKKEEGKWRVHRDFLSQ
jgi:beta-lactamase regulating signal transducer with metallopeptidase domain/ketosteroid isomerase-like protein